MIKLNRSSKPAELTQDVQDDLTNIFKVSGESVWNKKYIKDALFNMSNGKCCYCECKVGEESKYMEVEHFLCKKSYKDKVVEWDNLLPSCKRCNGIKNDHDVNDEPIINPSKDDPKDHIRMKNFRLYGKDELGRQTINVIALNDLDRLVRVRFDIGEKAQDTVESLCELANDYSKGIKSGTGVRNRIVVGTKRVLREAQPGSQFSATVATVVLSDPNYIELKSIISGLNFWDDELTQLENQAKSISLDT